MLHQWCVSRGVRIRFGMLFSALVLCLGGAVPVQAQASEPVWKQDFQSVQAGGAIPAPWRARGNFSLQGEGGNLWLELDGSGSLNWDIPLPKGAEHLRMRGRMKTTEVVAGSEAWRNGRLALEFQDAAGKHIGEWLRVPNATGTTPWKDFTVECPVPAGAVRFRITPANFGSGGKVAFDDLVLTAGNEKEPLQDFPAPAGFTPDPKLQRAWRQTNGKQERICLNSLWQFLPAQKDAVAVPGGDAGWGWFKVPGIWPSKGGYKVPATEQDLLIAPEAAGKMNLLDLNEAWYKRTITVPAGWQGRSIVLNFSMLQSYAQVFVDGKPAGEALFPGGMVDLSKALKPGSEQELAILVKARPLAKNRTVFMAPGRSFVEEGKLTLRGITGDLFLESWPPETQLRDARVRCSTRQKSITFDVALKKLPAGAQLEAAAYPCPPGALASGFEPQKAADGVTFAPVALAADALKNGRAQITLPWANPRLWDTDTPQNQYLAVLTLRDAAGQVLDQSLPVRFAFREFRIEGRDFYLNDKRIHLRALTLENINQGAGLADYAACVKTLQRLQKNGFNFFITDNYHFLPGGVGYLDGLLQAADDLGVLNAFSLPHVKDFDWKIDQPETLATYRQLADALLQRMSNRPSVVLYTMNHNATGYKGDQNPLRIDGKFDPDAPENGGASEKRTQSLLAAECVKNLDPTRPVYHHQSGNLGDMYTLNIYLNWSPRQERSDWLEHWEKEGVKPVFFVEWGLPHVASWSSYRGPDFIWRTPAFQQMWDAEFAAACKGESAYLPDPVATQSLLQQQDLYAKGQPFRWSELVPKLRGREHNYYEIQSVFAADNWRSLRARGLSAGLPWDQEGMWRGKSDGAAIPEAERYRGLEQPGIRPDRRSGSYDYLEAPDDSSFKPSSLGGTFLRWNRPFCAFLGGQPGDFSEKTHNIRAGGSVKKSVVLVNDTRRTVNAQWDWKVEGSALQGSGNTPVDAGGRVDVPVVLNLPAELAAGQYKLHLQVTADGEEPQTDEFMLDVLPAQPQMALQRSVTLLDSEGSAAEWMKKLGVAFRTISAGEPLPGPDGLLVIGRRALKMDTTLPGLAQKIKAGLPVLVLEQDEDVLTGRLGFRINVMGLREVYPLQGAAGRALAGLRPEQLADWAGRSTLTTPYLPGAEMDEPVWNWCGYENTRVWRAGNRGNVASVLIEKPEAGGFTPLLVGGFDLQYAPLLEWRQGKGHVLFCQMDLSGRTAEDPAALRLAGNLLTMLDAPAQEAQPSEAVAYSGDARGKKALSQLGIEVGSELQPGGVLVLGPGYDAKLDVTKFLQGGGRVLALALSAAETSRLAGGRITCADGLVMPVVPGEDTLARPELRGVSAADFYWRGKLHMAAFSGEGGFGNEALRILPGADAAGSLVFLQVAPWNFAAGEETYFRKSQRRVWFLVSRLLENLGASAQSPLTENLEQPGRITQISLGGGWFGTPDPDKKGRDAKWFAPDFKPENWRAVRVPYMFDAQFADLKDYDGLFWYRKSFDVPEGCDGEGLTLYLGVIDDESWVWLNGEFLGEITHGTNPKDHYSVVRKYELKKGALKPGTTNQLTVLVNDLRGKGGFRGKPAITAPGKWLSSYYIQKPVGDDDPYRYYRW